MAKITKDLVKASRVQSQYGVIVHRVTTAFSSGRTNSHLSYSAGNYAILVVSDDDHKFSIVYSSTLVISVNTFQEADFIATQLARQPSFPCPDTDRHFYFPTMVKRAGELSYFHNHPNAEEIV